MSQWAEIRHLHLVEGMPKNEIARRLQLDIKTVRCAVEQPMAPVRELSSRTYVMMISIGLTIISSGSTVSKNENRSARVQR